MTAHTFDRNACFVRRTTSVPQTHPPGTGWQQWLYVSPYRHRLVEAWRRDWQEIEVIPTMGCPAINVDGLWWRPCRQVPEDEYLARIFEGTD